MKRTIITAVALAVVLGVATPAHAVTPPFPANWECVAPKPDQPMQVWNCKATNVVTAGGNPYRPAWAAHRASLKTGRQATAAGIQAAVAGSGCRYFKGKKWNCTTLLQVAYVP